MRKLAIAFAAVMMSGSASAAPILEGSIEGPSTVETGVSTLGSLNVNAFEAAATGGPALVPEFVSNLVPVPEPSTWAMMIAGFGVIGAVSRRRVRSTRVSFA